MAKKRAKILEKLFRIECFDLTYCVYKLKNFP